MTCDCNTNQNNCGCSTDYAPENTIDYYYNQTDPSENKISIYEDSPILYSDTDARLLDALGNPHKIKFTDDGDSSKIEKGRKFRIPINGDNDNFAEFEILEVDHSGLNSFDAAVIKNTKTNEIILWADGSKGFNNMTDSDNEHKIRTIYDLIVDWVVNDVVGIGTSSRFPQLEALKNFATKYNKDHPQEKITTGIGGSMIGVAMSALAITKQFEDVNFRTYSGCVTVGMVEKLRKYGTAANGWELSAPEKIGKNLQCFYTPGEPLLNLIEPFQGNASFFMKESTIKTGFEAHGAEAYFNCCCGNSKYYQIKKFYKDTFPIWKAQITADKGTSPIVPTAPVVTIDIKTGKVPDKHEMVEVADEVRKALENKDKIPYVIVIKYNEIKYKPVDLTKFHLSSQDIKKDNPNLEDQLSLDDNTVYLEINDNYEYVDSLNVTKEYLDELKITEEILDLLKELFDKSYDVNPTATDPILIDLNGDGIKTTNVKNGINIDYQSDGFAEKSAWVSNEDGVLFIDRNNNNIIDNGNELFGENYIKSNNSMAISGFDALSDLDSNNDGIVDSNDNEFLNIKIQKGDGTIISLEEAGIASINLSSSIVNKEDANGNIKIESGTYNRIDGYTGEIGSYGLQVDYMNSQALENIEVSNEVKLLPNISGHGKMYDLHQTIMRDENLEILVRNFVEATNDNRRVELLEQILLKWTGSENVGLNSRGENVNAQHLCILEKFMGKDFYSNYDTENGNTNPYNPNKQAGDIISTIYNKFFIYMYAQMVSKSSLSQILDKIIYSLDLNTNKIICNLDNLISFLCDSIENNEKEGKQLVYEVTKMLKGLGITDCSNYFDPKDDSCFYTTFTKDDRELKWLIDTIGKVPYTDEIGDGEGSAADDSYRLEEQGHFHSLSGDDVAYGSDEDDSFAMCSGDDLVDAGDGNDIIDTHGGNDIVYAGAGNDIIHASDGNDIIYGGDGDDTIYPDHGDDFSWAEFGNDTIIGGKGNDTIISMTGDDTFIFNIGDGQDTIIEHQGVDTLYFGPNITWEDLTFTQSENDMVISINDTTDSITVKDWFTADEDGVYRYNNHKIEIFEFADGSKHTKDEITVGNNTESITYNMDEIGEWVETASNYKNTVNLKEGRNDIVAGENSDDTYVLSQEFSDVLIKDYSGNNKIVFDNENITLANTFFAYNEEGLEVWFDYFESHLQLNGNNFSFEFSDGTTVTDLFNILTRDVSYTDYVMGNNLQELTLLGNDSVTVTGNDNNNLIRGNYGYTTFIGGLGDDNFESLYNTNDTYVFNINDGNDYIIDLGGNDTIQFGVGITQENRKIHEETIELKQAA